MCVSRILCLVGVERAGYEPGKVVSSQLVNIFACHYKKTEFYPVVSREF